MTRSRRRVRLIILGLDRNSDIMGCENRQISVIRFLASVRPTVTVACSIVFSWLSRFVLTVRVLKTDVVTLTDSVGNRVQPRTRSIVLHVVAVLDLKWPTSFMTISFDSDLIISRVFAGRLTCSMVSSSFRLGSRAVSSVCLGVSGRWWVCSYSFSIVSFVVRVTFDDYVVVVMFTFVRLITVIASIFDIMAVIVRIISG